MKHKIILFLATIIENVIYPFRRLLQPSVIELLVKNSKIDSANFIQNNIQNSLIFYKRFDLYKYILNIKLNRAYVYYEFGVASGHSLNFIAKLNSQSFCFGFDSFTGLDEDWTGTHAARGFFKRKSKPKVQKNVNIISSNFKDLNFDHLKLFKISNYCKVINVDCDTYLSTKIVLNFIKSELKLHDIIILDDYLGYPGYKLHQFKAWNEFALENKINFHYIAFSNNQAAVEIL